MMPEADGRVSRFTENALEMAPGGGGGDPWAATDLDEYPDGSAGKLLFKLGIGEPDDP